MSDSNRAELKYVEESVYGTTPASPALKTLRYVNESLGQDTGSISSQEIRADRQVSNLIRNSVSASGDINFELSYGTYDDFLQSSLQGSAWPTATSYGASKAFVIANVSGNTWTITGTTGMATALFGAGTAPASAIGRWVQTKSSATATSNGFHKIVSCTETVLTVVSTTLAAASTDNAMKICYMPAVENGTTFKSYFLQRQYLDLSNTYATFNGLSPSGMSLNITADGIVTGSFTFLGKKEVSAASAPASSTTVAATTTTQMNAIDNIVGVVENTGNASIISATLQLNNNLRARQQVGTLGAISIGSGTVSVTGTLRAYFTSSTVMDEYLNFTASNLTFKFTDDVGNCYILDLPAVKFSNGRRVSGGINTDIVADMSFTAYMHPTELVTMRVARSAFNA